MSVRFMGLELETAPGVLVPREETELLARTALDLIDEASATRVIDMCCGAGNLACALAHARPSLEVFATDLTDPCVTLARRNIARLGLGDRVDVRQGDLFASVRDVGKVDVVVCNPPYISTGRLAKDSAHLLEREPREAFDGGPYGLSIHQRVLREAPELLRPGGFLAFEIGLGQDRQLELLFGRARVYEAPRSFRDATGAVRVVAARLLQL